MDADGELVIDLMIELSLEWEQCPFCRWGSHHDLTA